VSPVHIGVVLRIALRSDGNAWANTERPIGCSLRVIVDSPLVPKFPDLATARNGVPSHRRLVSGRCCLTGTKNYIRIELGDRVQVELTPYDLDRVRITHR